MPTFDVERFLLSAGARSVAGVDEVGRGAWAGPVVVCAAVPGRDEPPDGLTDSKLLAAERRPAIADEARDWAAAYGIGQASVAEIDEHGMTEALRLAATRALAALPNRPDMVILDGGHDYLGHPWRVRTEIKADLKCLSVAAASVIAKVYRDALMAGLADECPAFAFGENAGYPSPAHQEALAVQGPTRHHRLSWSFMDDLPEWRHLKKYRDPSVCVGQESLF